MLVAQLGNHLIESCLVRQLYMTTAAQLDNMTQ